MDLNKLREEISNIDKQLVRLFEDRLNIALKIGEYKKKNKIPVYDDKREEIVVEKSKSYLNNKSYSKYIIKFISTIMEISRDIQHNLDNHVFNNKDTKDIKVGFQGVEGSFSEQALKDYFGDNIKTINFKEFEDVFKGMSDNIIDYGVLPIENSSTGSIMKIYDLLRKYGLNIIGEKCIKVKHNLIGIQDADENTIKKVYSHPQAFLQCEDYLKLHTNWELIPYINTANSVKRVKEEGSKEIAAIGSERAAKLYNLKIIKDGINCFDNNNTRFIIIGKLMNVTNESNKISILVSLKHEPGALHKILKHFADNNLNMLKIESRPIEYKSWEYFFYIDFEGNLNDNKVKNALDNIENESKYFKLLGNYKKDTGGR